MVTTSISKTTIKINDGEDYSSYSSRVNRRKRTTRCAYETNHTDIAIILLNSSQTLIPPAERPGLKTANYSLPTLANLHKVPISPTLTAISLLANCSQVSVGHPTAPPTPTCNSRMALTRVSSQAETTVAGSPTSP